MKPYAILAGLGLLVAGCAQPGPAEWPAPIAPFPAVALAVEAGDSVVLRHTRTQRIERVRLEGIDAPEQDQPWGPDAAAALAARLRDASLVVTATAREGDGSLRGWICVAEEPYFANWNYPDCAPVESVNRSLVQTGDAWAGRGDETPPTLVEAQTGAQGRRAGLWADAGPVPPWQWRDLGPNKRGAILAAAGPVRTPAPGVPTAPLAGGPVDVDYSWLFGVAPAEDDDEPMNSAWLQDWRALIGELF